MTLTPAYRLGTHRLVSPEDTLAGLTPHLAAFGITRLADVTGLDADLGLPVYMAIRPRGAVLQSSAGKGVTAAAAKVSALMEAVELDVAERPDPARLRRASRAELRAAGERADLLPEWAAASGRFASDDYRLPWVIAEDLLAGGTVWLPAGAAFFCEPSPCRTNTNGLASGNHVVEATLHGLYEVIERDAVARMIEGEQVAIARHGRVIDPASLADPLLAEVLAAIARADSKLVLIELHAGLAIPTYWAILLNRRPFAGISTLNTGYGTHLDPQVARWRAVSEAIQSRLTAIHGARDDLVERPAYGAPAIEAGPAFQFFDALIPEPAAAEIPYTGDFSDALTGVLAQLRAAGHDRIYRVDLGGPIAGVSVIKIVAPQLRFESRIG
jgi:ribosomal protein S12 methylthiotransferase accessory factor